MVGFNLINYINSNFHVLVNTPMNGKIRGNFPIVNLSNQNLKSMTQTRFTFNICLHVKDRNINFIYTLNFFFQRWKKWYCWQLETAFMVAIACSSQGNCKTISLQWLSHLVAIAGTFVAIVLTFRCNCLHTSWQLLVQLVEAIVFPYRGNWPKKLSQLPAHLVAIAQTCPPRLCLGGIREDLMHFLWREN